MATLAIDQPINYRELFKEACEDLAECIQIPNSWLPKEYHQKKEFTVVDYQKEDGSYSTKPVYGPTAGELRRMVEKFNEPVITMDFVKSEKERRIELYAQQWEETGEITYEPAICDVMRKMADST